MTKHDPISRVSVLSTGTVQIRPEHVGPTRKNTYLWLATSQQWTEPRPINTYVIEHRNGLVLFDTGQDRRSVTDPGYFPGGLTGVIYDRLARFDIGPDQTLARQLATLGHRIGDVHTAVLSHLHQDHIGGLPELGQATIVVSADEWSSMQRPLAAPAASSARTSTWPGCAGTGYTSNRWARPISHRSRPGTTCSATLASSCCPRRGTRPDRCH